MNQFLKTVIEVRMAQIENPIPHLQLIDDCWHHIFDFLTVKDILNMSATSKRMMHICGCYLRTFCPKKRFYAADGIYRDISCFEPLQIDLYQYMKKLCIKEQNFHNTVSFLCGVEIKFESLKTFILSNNSVFHHPDFSNLLHKIENIENIKITESRIYDARNVFTAISNNCFKLTSLKVKRTRNGKLLFSKTFGSLKSLEYEAYYMNNTEIENLNRFLNRHSLKYLKLDYTSFWLNRDRLNNTNVCIETLDICFNCDITVIELTIGII